MIHGTEVKWTHVMNKFCSPGQNLSHVCVFQEKVSII